MEYKNGLWFFYIDEKEFSNENFVDLVKLVYINVEKR